MNTQIVNKIKEMTIERLSEILDFLQIEYTDYGSYYSLCCPFHGSLKKDSVSIYKNTGMWSCWTGGCHEEYGRGIFDFTKAYLSILGEDKNISQVAQFCASILNT